MFTDEQFDAFLKKVVEYWNILEDYTKKAYAEVSKWFMQLLQLLGITRPLN